MHRIFHRRSQRSGGDTGESAASAAAAATTTPGVRSDGSPFRSLTLIDDREVLEGRSGTVAFYVNEHGQTIAAKMIRADEHGVVTNQDLEREWRGYRRIVERVGPHPNLQHLHGLAPVEFQGQVCEALLSDEVPGPRADHVFEFASRMRRAGILTEREFLGFHQMTTGVLLQVIARVLGPSGVAHCDITPANIHYNVHRREPVLMDCGRWSSPDDESFGGDRTFSPPNYRAQDEKSDVFMVAATLVTAVQGDEAYQPNSDYSQFVERCMSETLTAEQALQLPFIANRFLSDTEAKAVFDRIWSFMTTHASA